MRFHHCAAFVSAAFAAAAHGQQYDMAEIQKWSNVKKVRYQVSAAYAGWTPISAERAAAQGNVTDSFTMEFDWDARKKALIGPPKFKNGKASVKEFRDDPECKRPVLKGEYEHFEITEAKAGGRELIALTATRSFPDASVAKQCPASSALYPVAGKKTTVTENLAVPDPGIMATASMGVATLPNMAFSPDKKSFLLKVHGWTYTYTPTPIP